MIYVFYDMNDFEIDDKRCIDSLILNDERTLIIKRIRSNEQALS
jgi:hypothetical protein